MHAPQRNLERHLKCLGGGGGDHLGGRSGERISDKLDWLADHIGEPRGDARMFKLGNGSSQRRQVAFAHACKVQHRLRSPSAGEPALYGGLVRGRGGDPAERTFRQFVNAEGKQPRGRDAKPYGPIGLLLNQLQGACKTLGFA